MNTLKSVLTKLKSFLSKKIANKIAKKVSIETIFYCKFWHLNFALMLPKVRITFSWKSV